LWDNILMELMPEGRGVWGFSNDDSHLLDAIGYSFNMLLMPGLTADEAKASMQNGAFYAVARVARPEGVNTGLVRGLIPSGIVLTLPLLCQPTPGISGITVGDNTITIAGSDYDKIEWIADGVVIATGASFDIGANWDNINHNYVRAQLVSRTGIAFTQPFGIWDENAELPQAFASASVTPDAPEVQDTLDIQDTPE
jgi:hypothetical protein